MTDLRKAAEMALEALENGKRVRAGEGGTKYQPDLEDVAIAALQQALAQPEQIDALPPTANAVYWMEMVVVNLVRAGVNKHRARELAHHFYTYKTTGEQEPVAYMSIVEKDSAFDKFRFVQSDMYPTPVYTAPPPKPWVGLTDEERRHYNNRLSGSGVAEEIDALLKEKNT